MKSKVIQSPEFTDAEDLIENSIEKSRMLNIVGECTVNYEGRTRSFLENGDRMIIRKPDGNFLVHTDSNRKPVNWQPEGSTCEVECDDEKLTVTTRSTSPNETIVVTFHKIYTVSAYSIQDDQEIEKIGTEENIQEYILENPEFVEDGFRIKEGEWKMKVGSVDVFGYDSNGEPTIIEIKRRRAGPDAVQQLRRYVEAFEDKNDNVDQPSGILMAPSLTDSAEEQLNKYGFRFVETPSEMYSTQQSTKITDFT